MSSVCYPPGADWSCAYTEAELAEMRADPAIAATMDRSEALAWTTLATLTADQIGTCPITVRPCLAGCDGWGTWLTYPVGSGRYAGVRTGESALNPHVGPDGVWVNGCGCSSTDCSCESLCEAILPGTVGHIVEVRLDGAVLAPSAYRVDNGNRLVRTDGDCWPACQDMSSPATVDAYDDWSGTFGTTGEYTFTRAGDTVTLVVTPDVTDSLVGTPIPDRFRPELYNVVGNNKAVRVWVQNDAGVGTFLINREVGALADLVMTYTAVPATPDVIGVPDTFAVTYYQGAAPDDLTLWAAGLLAVEFYKACRNQACRLPLHVQTVTRQGVTYQINQDMFTDGGTGIREVDALVARYNPFRLRARPLVTSPDVRKPRLQTWGR